MSELNDKDINIEKFAGKAIKNEKILSKLLSGILNKVETIRYNSYNILHYISDKYPEIIYSKFDFFVKMLESSNTYHQNSAVDIIANLTFTDPEKKFEKIFEKYFDLFKIPKTIVPAKLARNSGKIANAKPELQNKITDKLLNIDELHHGKQIELIKSYVIESFDEYFENIENKEDILNLSLIHI